MKGFSEGSERQSRREFVSSPTGSRARARTSPCGRWRRVPGSGARASFPDNFQTPPEIPERERSC
jgi:hypothetical protein